MGTGPIPATKKALDLAYRRIYNFHKLQKIKNIKYVTSQPWPFPASLMLGCTGEAQNRTVQIDRDELEDGPWPSFVTGLKRLRDSDEKQYSPMMNDLLGQLEHSYETTRGFWKGGTVGVRGYGGGVIPRFSEVAEKYPESKEYQKVKEMGWEVGEEGMEFPL